MGGDAAATWTHAAGVALGAGALLALGVWTVSVRKRDVSIVDSAWGFLVLVPALVFATLSSEPGPRTVAVLGLATAWAVRLAAYIAWRHHGQPEERRYQTIRRRNEPHFQWKSMYLVFGLQALLGWIVAAPLMAAVASPLPWTPLDTLGLAVAASGLAYEALADAQMARFRADPGNRGQVMDRGLWRYSRHPNYFGECCLWWGLWLVGAAGGAWWTAVSPLLMTVLLCKVSGVPLLERDLGCHRTGYADYVRRTPAFVPWRLRG